MKFNAIEPQVSQEQATKASRVFASLFMELGLCAGNEHCGTGIGGNNRQMLVLSCFEHDLSDGIGNADLFASATSNRLYWDSAWLCKTKMKDIRTKLNEVFPALDERLVSMSDVIHDMMATDPDWRQLIMKHKDKLPKLMNALEAKSFQYDPTMSPIEQHLYALIMCQDMSAKIDQGDNSSVGPISQVLLDFPLEASVYALRRAVSLERAVKYDLDMDPNFDKLLRKLDGTYTDIGDHNGSEDQG